MTENKERIKVVVRCRPLNKVEIQKGLIKIIETAKDKGEIAVKQIDETKQERSFYYDNVYDDTSKQEDVFEETALPIINSIMEGYNGTIFAYGQTGTGKTHTMEGYGSDPGIIPRSFSKIFELIKQKSTTSNYLIRVSYLEIYNEKIRDLLVKDNKEIFLDIREHKERGFYVDGLKEFVVKSVEEMVQLQKKGSAQREVAGHNMNDRSSRSHTIFTIVVENSYLDQLGKEHIRIGKLNLVDLAGSERQSKTGAEGEVLEQAIHINQSLATLGNVVSALVLGKKHVPFRDSKLTKMLQDSLGGNSKTIMIANIGPADMNYEETVSTLRYANRVKQIKTKPKINEDPKDAMIRQYQEELNKLKEELAKAGGGGVQVDNGDGENGSIIQSYVPKEKIEEMENKLKQEKDVMEREMEKEKKKILESKNTAEDEKMNLLKKLEKKKEDQQVQQKNKEKIFEKLKKLEEKFVIGTETEKKAKENEELLNKNQKELEEQIRKREELQKKINENEELTVIMQKKYTDQKAEVKDKMNIFEKLKGILREVENENQDIEVEYQKQYKELYEVKRNIEKERSYYDSLINYFIPNEYLNWIETQLSYDEMTGEWIMPEFNIGKMKRNKSDFRDRRLAVGFNDDEQCKIKYYIYIIFFI